MLDIKFIRENLEQVKAAVKNRQMNINVDHLIAVDDQRRKLIIETEALRSRRNEISEKLKKEKDEQLIDESRSLKEKLGQLELELTEVESQFKKAMLEVPNIPLADVPVGGDETANQVLRQWGKPIKFDFEIKDHVQLGEALNLIDIPRAAKVSGTRFAYLKNQAVLLEWALVQFVLKHLMPQGFEPILPPMLIKKNVTDDLGYWSFGGKENYYLVEDFQSDEQKQGNPNPLYLIGTGEHSVVPMYKDEVFKKGELPKKYVAFSSCFRREAGSYGRDTKGILRVHQFDKVEMIAFVRPEDDETVRKQMLGLVEKMTQELELPYQVVALCTADISFPAAETIDIETWIPSQNKYRETHSISTTTDFQARRLNTRFQDKDEKHFVHILNGTAFAIGRILIAIMENYQQEDGSIAVPKVLQEFTGFDVIKK